MKDRIVDLTPSLALSLEAYLKGKVPEDSVFGLQASTISGLIGWAAKRANVDLHCHSPRHFFGETLVDTGTDLETVRRLMGHSNLSTTQRYIGRTDQQRRDAIDRMENPMPDSKSAQDKSGKKFHPLEQHIITADGKGFIIVPPSSVEDVTIHKVNR